MGIRVFVLALTIGVSAQAVQEPFAWRECKQEISERREEYTLAYEEERISEDLYEVVMDFLEKTEEEITFENCLEVYPDFVDNYKELLRAYPKEAIKSSNDSICEKETLGIVEQTRCQYNLDMSYIEEELAIYGEYVNFELSEEKFQEALLTVNMKETTDKD